ncbi:MAG TPA: TfoX/Sxy family protein [Candidatus Binatia bacterium]|nr:TfoX/Sxy family protein [Candidatus Binatia bacterium]
MAWKKSPGALVAAFERLVPKTRDIERRSMFGYPAAFVKRRMFAGLHEDRLVLRLDDDTIAAAKARGATDFEPMAGRAMKGWIAVPARLVADDGSVPGWIEAAHRHVAGTPAKTPGRAQPAAGRPRKR